MNDAHRRAGDHRPEQPGLAPVSQRSQGPGFPLNPDPLPTPSSAQTSTSARWTTRLLDGDEVWGSIDISITRHGVTRYRLVVFPPGIDRVERRLLRAWRAWPTWGAGLWLVSLCLCSTLTPWARFTIPTIAWLGAGVFLFARVGQLRTQVRTLCVTRIAGYPNRQSAATYAEMNTLVTVLRSADTLRDQGRLSTTGHEATWWQVYDRLGPDHSRTVDANPSI